MIQMLKAQCTAELQRILRNPYYVFWSLLMPILFYIVFTRIVNTGVEDASWWKTHYLMSMTSFSVMGSSIMTLGIRMVQERSNGWATFLRITPLPGSVSFLAKMAGQTVMHLFSIVVIFLAGFLINGVSLSAGQWLACGAWVLLASAPFLALGTIIGSMSRVDTASGVSNAVYMILAITGGMWMPIDILPKVVQRISVWLPSYQFGNGAWAIVHGDAPQIKGILILLGYLAVFMVLSMYIRKKQEAV
ncbi:ABC transporter permease [Gorillibacterium sp. CAU 1737]|uniref:ABC transporter permease n=1 Tax=Gorillibacterium sp. CAU 1737 TaxID=3140362 RepID=UPI003261CA6D